MLGLGDVVMPGLLLCFVMRYDAYKRAQVTHHNYRCPANISHHCPFVFLLALKPQQHPHNHVYGW